MGFGRGSNFKSRSTARDIHKVTEVTAATYAIGEAENGHTLALNRAGGITLTLPPDTLPVGWNIKMVVLTTFTGTWKIATAADGDLMFGAYQVVSVAAAQEADVFAADADSNDNIVIDADNKGRLAGSWFEFFLMGENEWVVRGETYCTATPTTGWSDS
jgi:hypothetical protein|tara:strand:- start:1548 stop:2024 length:477 start_codon:yes stop_codon:yes gene_type:complete